jgi:hypothetical protein
MKQINYPNLNHYLIDKNGNIYSTLNSRGFPLKEPKLIKQWANKNVNYMQVVLQNKKAGIKPTALYVHRLVALTFIENIHNFSEVNHIDSNKLNNSVSNLEWCTKKYNMQHMALNRDYERIKFDRIVSDKKLVNAGVKHYKIYKNIKYLSNIWDCNNGICYEILKLNKVKTNSRYSLSNSIRIEIADEMMAVIHYRFPHGWKDLLKEKYYKKYGIVLTEFIIKRIKSDILKKIL